MKYSDCKNMTEYGGKFYGFLIEMEELGMTTAELSALKLLTPLGASFDAYLDAVFEVFEKESAIPNIHRLIQGLKDEEARTKRRIAEAEEKSNLQANSNPNLQDSGHGRGREPRGPAKLWWKKKKTEWKQE